MVLRRRRLLIWMVSVWWRHIRLVLQLVLGVVMLVCDGCSWWYRRKSFRLTRWWGLSHDMACLLVNVRWWLVSDDLGFM